MFFSAKWELLEHNRNTVGRMFVAPSTFYSNFSQHAFFGWSHCSYILIFLVTEWEIVVLYFDPSVHHSNMQFFVGTQSEQYVFYILVT